MRRSASGFTLMELMLVVAIIGILAAVALPAYGDYVVRSRVVEALDLGAPVQQAVIEFHDRWGVMPANNQQAGLPEAKALQGRYVEGIEVLTGGVVVISLGASLLGNHDGTKDAAPNTLYQLILRPALRSQAGTSLPVAWVCQTADAQPEAHVVDMPEDAQQLLEARYLPGVCRAKT